METVSNNQGIVTGAKKALQFLGYGDPASARIWFVGLEESIAFKTQGDFDVLPDTPFKAYAGCKGETTHVYVIISKIVAGLLGQNWKDTWREYRDHRLFSTNTEAVLLNLYPLGKDSLESWPTQYSEWFKMTRDQYYSWVANDESGRFSDIRSVRTQYENPLTVCFGSSAWPDFAKCLGLTDPPSPTERQWFHPCVEGRAILTPFFWPPDMSDDVRIPALIGFINDQGLNPFRSS